jgi:hypothetical protein
MTWGDFRRRRAAIEEVLAHVERHPDADLPFESLPSVREYFADRGELLLALQYEWTHAVWAHVSALRLDPLLQDPADVRREAWRRAAESLPSLRRLLDRWTPERVA